MKEVKDSSSRVGYGGNSLGLREQKGIEHSQPHCRPEEGLLPPQGPPCGVHRTGTLVCEIESMVLWVVAESGKNNR